MHLKGFVICQFPEGKALPTMKNSFLRKIEVQ